jgi:hypothetical protein
MNWLNIPSKLIDQCVGGMLHSALLGPWSSTFQQTTHRPCYRRCATPHAVVALQLPRLSASQPASQPCRAPTWPSGAPGTRKVDATNTPPGRSTRATSAIAACASRSCSPCAHWVGGSPEAFLPNTTGDRLDQHEHCPLAQCLPTAL